PLELIPKYGADALRWYFYNTGNPWSTRRISEEAIELGIRQEFLTLWNTYSFFVTYANIENFEPVNDFEPENILDRWIYSRLHSCVKAITEYMQDFNALSASNEISELIQ